MPTAVALWTFMHRRESVAKREAQQRIVQMILPEEGLASEIKLQRSGPDERLGSGE